MPRCSVGDGGSPSKRRQTSRSGGRDLMRMHPTLILSGMAAGAVAAAIALAPSASAQPGSHRASGEPGRTLPVAGRLPGRLHAADQPTVAVPVPLRLVAGHLTGLQERLHLCSDEPDERFCPRSGRRLKHDGVRSGVDPLPGAGRDLLRSFRARRGRRRPLRRRARSPAASCGTRRHPCRRGRRR